MPFTFLISSIELKAPFWLLYSTIARAFFCPIPEIAVSSSSDAVFIFTLLSDPFPEPPLFPPADVPSLPALSPPPVEG